MPTLTGIVYIVAVTVLFFFWMYGLVSFYFDLRHRFLPRVYAWLRSDDDRHHLM